jgi:hypothetical protein
VTVSCSVYLGLVETSRREPYNGDGFSTGVVPVARRFWAFVALALVIELIGLLGTRYLAWRWTAIGLVVAALVAGAVRAATGWRRHKRLTLAPSMQYQPVRSRHWHW